MEAAVARLFQELGEQAVDGTVCEYVAGFIKESDCFDVEELRDLLQGFSPQFSCLVVSEQDDKLRSLIAQVKEAEGGVQSAPTPNTAATAPILAACVEQQLDALSLGARAAAQPPALPLAGAALAAAGMAPAEDSAVELLRGLCGQGVPEGFLVHVLAERCQNQVDVAAAYLLDSADLAGEQRAWESEEARRRAEAEQAEQEKRLNRQKILHKFQLEAVAEAPPRKPQQISAWTAKDEPKAKVRFRDGRLVSTKGEKYIVEKGEEWDGGSRGKVYTKGKRGKGFV